MSEPIRVSIYDPLTGETEVVEVKDDYLIIEHGTCFISHTQVYQNGTHIVTIKRPGPESSS